MSDPIRVLLCEDHALFREGLSAILRDKESIQVVGEASTGREAVEKARRLRPHVVLMDIEMPEMSGLEATRRITGGGGPSKVLILTLYDDEEVVARCLDAGAAGYILKDGASAQLLYAIECVHKGQRYLSPTVLTKVVQYARKKGRTQTRYDVLTGREREVLKLLADGLSTKEIASRIALSAKTVDVHKTNLMRKLDIHDRAALVKYAIQQKLIRVPIFEPIE